MEQDLAEAYKWYRLASNHDAHASKEDLEKLKLRMSPDQIKAGEKRVTEFKPKITPPRN